MVTTEKNLHQNQCFKIRLFNVLTQGRATIYLNGPKRTTLIMLWASQFITKQKQLILILVL